MTDQPINLQQLRELAAENDALSQKEFDYVCDSVLALIDAAEAAREAIAESAVIIETLRAQDELKPYRELSPDFRAKLEPACDLLRTAAGHLAKFTWTQP